MAAGPLKEFSLNGGDWAYLNLELLSEQAVTMDMITWKLLITRGLAKYFGIHGTAIQTDIIHIINDGGHDNQCWLRVPQKDLTTVWSALSGSQSFVQQNSQDILTSIRVVRASHYLVGITGPEPYIGGMSSLSSGATLASEV